MLLKVRELPPVRQCFDDIGLPVDQVAKYLGVSPLTLRSWLKRDQAPRPGHLALFWVTSWAKRDLDVDLWNEAQTAFALVRAHERELARLNACIAMLQQAGDFGAANDPLVNTHRFPAPPRHRGRAAQVVQPLDVSLAARV